MKKTLVSALMLVSVVFASTSTQLSFTNNWGKNPLFNFVAES